MAAEIHAPGQVRQGKCSRTADTQQGRCLVGVGGTSLGWGDLLSRPQFPHPSRGFPRPPLAQCAGTYNPGHCSYLRVSYSRPVVLSWALGTEDRAMLWTRGPALRQLPGEVNIYGMNASQHIVPSGAPEARERLSRAAVKRCGPASLRQGHQREGREAGQGQSGLGKLGAELAGARKAGGAEAQPHSLTRSRMCTNKARDPKHTHAYLTCNHSHTGTHSSHTHVQRHALTHASSHTLRHIIHVVTGTRTDTRVHSPTPHTRTNLVHPRTPVRTH